MWLMGLTRCIQMASLSVNWVSLQTGMKHNRHYHHYSLSSSLCICRLYPTSKWFNLCISCVGCQRCDVFIVSFQNIAMKASLSEIILLCQLSCRIYEDERDKKKKKHSESTSISALSVVAAIGPHCDKICTFKQYAHFMSSITKFVLTQT